MNLSEIRRPHPDGSNMYDICEKYRRKNYEFIAILVAAAGALITIVYIGLMTKFRFPAGIMILIPIAVFLVVLITCLIRQKRKPKIDAIGKSAIDAQIDPKDVNEDFMNGERAFLTSGDQYPSGVFCIGEKYYVIFSTRIAHVGKLQDITDISFSSEFVNIPNRHEWFYKTTITIYEKNKSFKIYTADNDSKDTIIIRVKKVLNIKNAPEEPEETLDGLI